MNKYPIFIPSKGRADVCLTANCLIEENQKFFIAIEPQDLKSYSKRYNLDRLLVMDRNNAGVAYVRQWIKDYCVNKGHTRHWQIDDDMKGVLRYNKGKRVHVAFTEAIQSVEDFTDKYQNIGITNLNSQVFVFSKKTPYTLNKMAYGFMLLKTDMDCKFRLSMGDDADYSLQVLSKNYCTVGFNAYVFETEASGSNKGGNYEVYKKQGRLDIARNLQKHWPYLVNLGWKFNRPNHNLSSIWKYFDNKLIRNEN